MAVTGFRPRGSDGPMYSPERDLAYLTPSLMAGSLQRLAEENWTPELRNWLEAAEIDTALLGETIDRLAEGQATFVSADPSPESPYAALLHAGFFTMPYLAQRAVFAALGEGLVGAWFLAVRDVTNIMEDSPAKREIAEFVAAAQAVSAALGHHKLLPQDELKVKYLELKTQLAIANQKLAAHDRNAQAITVAAHTLSQTAKCEVQDARKDTAMLRQQLLQLQRDSLWGHLKTWWYNLGRK